MKKILIVLGFLLFPHLAEAQSQRNPCYYTTTGLTACQPVGTSTNGVGNGPLPVGGKSTAAAPTFVEGQQGGLSFDLTGNLRTTSSGGGGGLSVVDQTVFVQGTSAFTPTGGVFNDTATLTSGQEGTVRLTTKRALIADVDTTGNALYSAITSGVLTPGSAIPSTGIYIGGNVGGTGRGWTFVNPTGTVYAGQIDIASLAGTTIKTGSGNGTAGSGNNYIPTDQPNLTTPLNVASSQNYGAGQLTHAAVSFASSGDNTVITRVTGTIKVYQLVLSCASQLTTIAVKDGASNALGANSATQYISLGIQSEPLYTTTSTNNFVINLSSAVTCTGFVKYKDT